MMERLGWLFCLLVAILFQNEVKANTNQLEPKLQLARFLQTNDTSNVLRALQKINTSHFYLQDTSLLSILKEMSHKENMFEIKVLKELYLALRDFYKVSPNETNYFEYLLKIYKVSKRLQDHDATLWILVDIGNVFFNERDYKQAAIFYKKAEYYAQISNSNYGKSVILMNLGMIKDKQGKYKEAIDAYETAIFYRFLAGYYESSTINYAKIANCYLKLNKPKLTLFYLQKARETYAQIHPKSSFFQQIPFEIDYVYAAYYAHENKEERALFYIDKAIQYARFYFLKAEEIKANEFKYSYLMSRNHFLGSLKTADELMPFFIENGFLENQKSVYLLKKKCYTALGQFQHANEYTLKYIEINDSISKLAIHSELNMIRSIVDVYEIETNLEIDKRRLHFFKKSNIVRNNERNSYLFIAICSTIFAFLVFGLFLNTQKNKIQLMDIHNRLIEQNNHFKKNSIALNRSTKLKDNLFSIISTDLSEPLNQLMCELNKVQSELEDIQLTSNLEATLTETIELFSGLVEWSKSGNKNALYFPAKVSLDENINKIISFYAPEIQTRELLVINKSEAVATFADQNILQTLLRNMISNSITALKDATGQKWIEISTKSIENKWIELTIADSGPGFPAEIITQFYEADFEKNSKRKGLGLSICKGLAKMSGWEIKLGNTENHGAKISIVLPMFNLQAGKLTAQQFHLKKSFVRKMQPLLGFKVYQTTEIRNFLKIQKQRNSSSSNHWLFEFEKAVHQGDVVQYNQLLDMLKPSVKNRKYSHGKRKN